MASFLDPAPPKTHIFRAHNRKTKHMNKNKKQREQNKTTQTHGDFMMHVSLACYPKSLFASVHKVSRQHFTSSSLQQFYILVHERHANKRTTPKQPAPRSRYLSPESRKMTTLLHLDTMISPWTPHKGKRLHIENT